MTAAAIPQTQKHISVRRNFFELLSRQHMSPLDILHLHELTELTKPTLLMDSDLIRDLIKRMSEDEFQFDEDEGLLISNKTGPVFKVVFVPTVDVGKITILDFGAQYLRAKQDRNGNYILEYRKHG